MNCKVKNCKTQKWASNINFVTIVVTNASLETHANPLSHLPWQETFFVIILKNLST
jgi:hypothetical protein